MKFTGVIYSIEINLLQLDVQEGKEFVQLTHKHDSVRIMRSCAAASILIAWQPV